MEMQDLSEEKEKNEGASEVMVPVKTEVEEAEPDHYEQLKRPSEDVYEETLGRASLQTKAGKQSGGNPRPYRTACLFLGLICLILLLVVIILGVKLQTGSSFCPAAAGEEGASASTCSYAECQAQYNRIQSPQCQCQQCAPDWRAFGRSCFFFSSTRLSWEESLQNCTSRGGSLAVASSRELQAFLTKEAREDLMYWIGLRRTGATWKWVNNDVLQASYWAEEPRDGGCGFLHSLKPPAEKNWFNANCESSTYFICQLDL